MLRILRILRKQGSVKGGGKRQNEESSFFNTNWETVLKYSKDKTDNPEVEWTLLSGSDWIFISFRSSATWLVKMSTMKESQSGKNKYNPRKCRISLLCIFLWHMFRDKSSERCLWISKMWILILSTRTLLYSGCWMI